ncbi:hypothetical protein CDD83_3715 [Cordyceps sp. RAO-2017]|nr:hypothetical protein CDD83_3715 [Cordyceps sp. RAO-2017]
MAPVILPANQPKEGLYAGGARITAFRSSAPCSSHQPEDWVASTTCCGSSRSIGLSRLPDGVLLRDAVASDPTRWLGSEHVSRHGPDTKLLVKLLDAGQRLPVHAHPDGDWAARHLGARNGKAEAWYILTAGSVWLGLETAVEPDELRRLVEAERGHELLGRMHRIDVEPHQTVYVPPGMLHCTGEGVMVVEVQEPSDLAVLCEWRGFRIDGRRTGHMGLGFDTALTAVETGVRTRDEVLALVTAADRASSDSVYASASQQYFRLERRRINGRETCLRGFAVLVVLDGSASLATDDGRLVVGRGSTAVVPFADGDIVLEGDAEVLIARPPR